MPEWNTYYQNNDQEEEQEEGEQFSGKLLLFGISVISPVLYFPY